MTREHDTIRFSYDRHTDKRIWTRQVMRGETLNCFCGRVIVGYTEHGRHEVIAQHADGFYNPLTCKFRGEITPEMRQTLDDAQTS